MTTAGADPRAYSQPKYKLDYGRLRRNVQGAVKFDEITRALYASSASIVEVWPSCVVEPMDAADVIKTMQFAREHQVPITCRGAGSGVAGQSLGQGIILDFAVHMNRILETQPSEGWARVQPGVVKDDFDAELGSFGMFWPPDPSSSPWCTVGAMVSNNSGGAKSIRWGTAKDYLLELDVLLADGERVKLRPLEVLPEGRINFPADASAAEIKLAEATLKLARDNAESIAKERPESTRSSSGYNVFELLHADNSEVDIQTYFPRTEFDGTVGAGDVGGILDMPRLFSGSEGTLGILLEARLRVLRLPRKQAGLTLHFDSNQSMAEGVVKLLETRPTKLEVLDRSFIDVAAKSDPKLAEGIPENLASMLIVEYWAEDERDTRKSVDAAYKLLVDNGPAFGGTPAYDATELANAWTVRKVASPILSRVKGDLKPTRWIEDCAVPPWKLPQFIDGFKKICEDNGFTAHLFGHGGEGNLHVNPFANAKSESDRARMRKAADEVFALVKSLKGTISGEHGDGLMRTPYLREMYGDVYPLFEQLKQLFDPRFLLNPLNKVPSPLSRVPSPESTAGQEDSAPGTRNSERSITSFLRVGEDYQRQGTGTVLDRPEILEEIEKCHGCGKCRTYCPLMRVGKEEKYSARAKANLLRGVISGRLDGNLLLNAEFKANIDLCISCEQCLVDCPTQVDIPGISMVFREQYVDRKGKGGMVADMLSKPDKMGKVGQSMAGMTNKLLKNRFLRGMAQSVTGLDERRKLPVYKKPAGIAKLRQLDVPDEVHAKLPEEVVVFPGCYAEYYDPDGEKATLIEILRALGVAVHTPALNCCGISKITQGDSSGARADTTENVDKLLKPVRRGAKVVFSAPSCLISAKREWARIVDADGTREVADACVDAHELLLGVFEHPHMRKQLKSLGKRIAWHSPCHSKVLSISDAAKKLIDLLDEQTTVDLNAGCCGLSGTFGLKTDNFDMSMKIGQPLFTKINLARPDVVTSSCGICQSQIRQGVKSSEDGKDGAEIVHPLRLLYQALK